MWVKPKDQAREWLDQRSGRNVRVETCIANSGTAPLTNQGALLKPLIQRFETVDRLEGPAPVPDLYQVAGVSYNLADIPEDIEVEIPSDPAEQLEMTFENESAQSISVLITVIEEKG
jgi:hypothetical protein